MADLICTRTPRLVAKPRDTRCHCLPCRVQASERPPPCSLCSPNIYPAQSLNLWKKGLVDSGVPLPPSSISPATAFPESQGGGICHSCHALPLSFSSFLSLLINGFVIAASAAFLSASLAPLSKVQPRFHGSPPSLLPLSN